jgi:hypothetical protein
MFRAALAANGVLNAMVRDLGKTEVTDLGCRTFGK